MSRPQADSKFITCTRGAHIPFPLLSFIFTLIIMNPIELSLFSSRINAVCDEMGVVLRRTAQSPNIKDRLDFSCAVFDAAG